MICSPAKPGYVAYDMEEYQMWKKVLMGILLVLSATAGFFVAKAQVLYNNSLNQINRDYDTALANVDLSGIHVNSDDQIVNILVIGNDYREERGYGASGLTDTMIIATMDMKHGTLKTASLMRDLVVEIPGHGKNKLNSANSFGGIELLYKTIATNFNIELDGYVEVGFAAFTKIIDKVGGIELELTESEASYLNSTNYIRNKKSPFRHDPLQGLVGRNARQYLPLEVILLFLACTRIFSQQRTQAYIESGVQFLCPRGKAQCHSLPEITGEIGFLHRPASVPAFTKPFFLYPQSQYGPPEARVYCRTKFVAAPASLMV